MPGLIFSLLLSIVTFASDAPPTLNELEALVGFWIFFIVLVVIPFLIKLEIGPDYVKSYLCGLCLRTIQSSRVQVASYGDLFRGGLGIGKGLKGWELVHPERKLFRNKYFSIGEQLYGKEALVHAKRVLESHLRQKQHTAGSFFALVDAAAPKALDSLAPRVTT